MARKPTYEELKQRVNELEKEAFLPNTSKKEVVFYLNLQ